MIIYATRYSSWDARVPMFFYFIPMSPVMFLTLRFVNRRYGIQLSRAIVMLWDRDTKKKHTEFTYTHTHSMYVQFVMVEKRKKNSNKKIKSRNEYSIYLVRHIVVHYEKGRKMLPVYGLMHIYVSYDTLMVWHRLSARSFIYRSNGQIFINVHNFAQLAMNA